MQRYSPEEVGVLMYHLHIPTPDPMTNPSTEARAKFCEAESTPSYAIDGKLATGGGSRDEAKSFYDTLNSQIEERLEKPVEAQISLHASLEGGVVSVRATVDKVTSKSPYLMLQIALVEDHLTYSGENGMRFHPMVVRSLGGEKAGGFEFDRMRATTIEHAFDLSRITQEIKKHLDDMEAARKMTFTQKKHEIKKENLFVAAFVQDTKSKQVLQAAFVKVN
jgi:hypothetical protein